MSNELQQELEDVVVYTPGAEQVKMLGDYFEAWQGLPNVEFEAAETSGGQPALKYEHDGNYIWIPSYKITELTPVTTFSVLRQKREKVRAVRVEAKKADASVDDIAKLSSHLQELNQGFIIEKLVEASYQREFASIKAGKARVYALTGRLSELVDYVRHQCMRMGFEPMRGDIQQWFGRKMQGSYVQISRR